MFYDKEFAFLRKVLNECNLQNSVLKPDSPIDENFDKGLRKLFNISGGKKNFSDFFPEIKPRTIYRATDVFLFNYIFFLLPYCNSEQIFTVGPYLNSELSHAEIFEQGEKMSLSPQHTKNLELFYSSIPIIKDEYTVLTMINTFAEFIFDGKFENMDINLEKTVAFLPFYSEQKTLSEDTVVNFRVLEERYKFENELIEAVSQGNSRKAELMMTRFSVLTFENRVPDKLRNLKNYCIIMNTLLRKAAENGGVHPFYLDRVSSDFAKQIEAINSLTNITDFMLTVMKTYCLLVKKHSVKNYSPIIQKAILRIENDLTSNLTLSEMAKISNVSPSYFSSLFKKETGSSLTDYVNEKRVERAKHLLRTTNLQIQSVAQHCGILDFHYFCRIFKKTTGKTPTQYRSTLSFEQYKH